jgi:hypothetical protein
MRNERPSASVSAHAPPRMRSQARTSPTLDTLSGTSTLSFATPSDSRTPAKNLNSTFMIAFDATSTHQF